MTTNKRKNKYNVMTMRKDSRYQVQYVVLNNLYVYLDYLSRKTAYELSKSLNDLDKIYYKKLSKLNKMRNKALNERTNYLKSVNHNFEGHNANT